MRPGLIKGEAQCLALLAFRAGAAGSFLLSLIFLLVASAGFPAFGSAHAQSRQPKSESLQASRVVDYASLLADLRAKGLRAEFSGKIVQPFFTVAGRVIQVNGQDLQVFQYPDAARAKAQAALVSPDGLAVATTKVHWLAPPRFYKRGKLLVIYLGDDGDVLKILEAALGPHFAGKQR
jgi:hypothetical protein